MLFFFLKNSGFPPFQTHKPLLASPISGNLFEFSTACVHLFFILSGFNSPGLVQKFKKNIWFWENPLLEDSCLEHVVGCP